MALSVALPLSVILVMCLVKSRGTPAFSIGIHLDPNTIAKRAMTPNEARPVLMKVCPRRRAAGGEAAPLVDTAVASESSEIAFTRAVNRSRDPES